MLTRGLLYHVPPVFGKNTFSEVAKLQRLKQMLAVYRLAFGQPRQEDLLAYLNKAGTSDDSKGERGNYRICLKPR